MAKASYRDNARLKDEYCALSSIINWLVTLLGSNYCKNSIGNLFVDGISSRLLLKIGGGEYLDP